MTSDPAELFDALPTHTRSAVVRDGRFLLRPCSSCRGTGRSRYSAFSSGYAAERFSERCGTCGGVGRQLVKARGRKINV